MLIHFYIIDDMFCPYHRNTSVLSILDRYVFLIVSTIVSDVQVINVKY